MADVRLVRPQEPRDAHDCDRIHLDGYDMEEVILPVVRERRNVKAIRVVVRGRNLRAAAQPLLLFVGKDLLQFLRIAPDERSVEGILLKDPEAGALVEARLGDQDAARLAVPVALQAIKRLPPR